MSEHQKFRTGLFLCMVVGVPAIAAFLTFLPNLIGKEAAIFLFCAIPIVALAWIVASPRKRYK